MTTHAQALEAAKVLLDWCSDPQPSGEHASEHATKFSLFDSIARCLAVNPDYYEASDCEQALVLAIAAGDVTELDLFHAIGKVQDALPYGLPVQPAYSPSVLPALVLALKDVISAWTNGERSSDFFGDHAAVKDARRALALAEQSHR